MIVIEEREPDSIDCTELVKAGYPFTYQVPQKGLEMMGWQYDIGTDCWRRPAGRPGGRDDC
jgi:hypothetical protein